LIFLFIPVSSSSFSRVAIKMQAGKTY